MGVTVKQLLEFLKKFEDTDLEITITGKVIAKHPEDLPKRIYYDDATVVAFNKRPDCIELEIEDMEWW